MEYKLKTPNVSGVLVDLYNVGGYKDTSFIEVGNYFRIEKYSGSDLEPEDSYNTCERNDSLAFFRIWLENLGIFSKEDMISLLKFGNDNLAGLILLSWMREVYSIDPTVSWVKLSEEDWSTVLTFLTCNEHVRE